MALSNIQLLGNLNIRGTRQFSHGGRRVLQKTVETVVKSYPVGRVRGYKHLDVLE